MRIDLTEFFKNHWLILAPMAGINDTVFRQLCVEQGALLTYTEMVSSKALSYNNPRTENLLELAPDEKKVVVQLFGHEPQTMANEAKRVEDKLGKKLAYIDINMGCPARKITKKGDGSALLKDASLSKRIVEECNKSCNSPITVKIRKGFNEGEDASLDFAKAMEEAGASAVTIHARTAQQFYKGSADLSAGKKLVDYLDIPVIWSGDITSRSEALKLKETDGYAAVMIGRAARGNPFLFNDKEASYAERIETAKRHVEEYSKLYPRNLAYMRKHCNWYVHGMPGATFARDKFSHCDTVDDYIGVLNELEERLCK